MVGNGRKIPLSLHPSCFNKVGLPRPTQTLNKWKGQCGRVALLRTLCAVHSGRLRCCSLCFTLCPTGCFRPSPRLCCLLQQPIGNHPLVSSQRSGGPNGSPAIYIDHCRGKRATVFGADVDGSSRPGPDGLAMVELVAPLNVNLCSPPSAVLLRVVQRNDHHASQLSPLSRPNRCPRSIR